MNSQPYRTPPKFWAPKLSRPIFKIFRYFRNRDLAKQKIVEVEIRNTDKLARSLDQDQGILLTPNHSFHFDSYCLLHAADQLDVPFYFMTAWQVFGVSTPWQQWVMQKNGCFSVNREGIDTESFKVANDILQNRKEPLVIFPEGDIYHTNDHVTPFREGAAAIAISAARRSKRPLSIIPVAIKAKYLEDPLPGVLPTLTKLEQRLLWNPSTTMPVVDRIVRVASAALGLKEFEILGLVQSGELPERIKKFLLTILENYEATLGIKNIGHLPSDRIAEIRRRSIAVTKNGPLSIEQERELQQTLDRMFLATQLYSYPGNYLVTNPTPERIAETVDKLEEDLLGVTYPTVRGNRKVIVDFGDPVPVSSSKGNAPSPAELSDSLRLQVQSLLDQL